MDEIVTESTKMDMRYRKIEINKKKNAIRVYFFNINILECINML